MVTSVQLAQMDDYTSHVNLRLLDSNAYVRPTSTVPLRNRTDTFKRFNSNTGSVVVRGADDHHFDNPRVFGKSLTLLIQQT